MFGGYRFEMIVGCMNAGKSSELIRRIERARLAYLPALMVRPATDTRSTENYVETRNGRALEAIVVGTPGEILQHSLQAVVIGIDECQFFSDEIIDVIQKLLKQKKKIIASGLDLDFTGKPFGPVPRLLALADRIDKLLAVCRKCGSEFACRTQRLVQSNEQILVGDAQYEARCINCFDPPHEFQLQIPLNGVGNGISTGVGNAVGNAVRNDTGNGLGDSIDNAVDNGITNATNNFVPARPSNATAVLPISDAAKTSAQQEAAPDEFYSPFFGDIQISVL